MNLHEEFWDNVAKGDFKVRRCAGCGTWQFPPLTLCRQCLSSDVRWEEASGKGTLWSWIRIHKPYFKDFADEVPYLVAMVELQEGPLMVSSILDADASDLKCGAEVELSIVERPGGRSLPYFRLVTDAA